MISTSQLHEKICCSILNMSEQLDKYVLDGSYKNISNSIYVQ